MLAVGIPSCALAASLAPGAALSAAAQDWPAFVLVAGLLLVGFVASEAGLFLAAGNRLARMPGGEMARFVWSAVLIGLVSALLNLDTAAAFLTPVLVHMAYTRRRAEAPVLYSCLLLTNAGSLLLPGSNLTNLIVTGHLRLTGTTFAGHMAPAWAISLVITAVVIAVAHRKDLLAQAPDPGTGPSPIAPASPIAIASPSTGTGTNPSTGTRTTQIRWRSAAAVVAALVAMALLRNAALVVLGIGAIAAVVEISMNRANFRKAIRAIDLPVLSGLFGIAVALGTLGRTWDGPARLLAHLGTFATAGVAAVASITFNNLPAASLLASRVPPHPYALLVGLDLGPNLFVTGSLSAFLWFRAARQAGVQPSWRHASALGLVAAPLAIAGAVGILAAASVH